MLYASDLEKIIKSVEVTGYREVLIGDIKYGYSKIVKCIRFGNSDCTRSTYGDCRFYVSILY